MKQKEESLTVTKGVTKCENLFEFFRKAYRKPESYINIGNIPYKVFKVVR